MDLALASVTLNVAPRASDLFKANRLNGFKKSGSYGSVDLEVTGLVCWYGFRLFNVIANSFPSPMLFDLVKLVNSELPKSKL